jgi:hypothetical protein
VTSMRKLRRRLLRWERYDRRYINNTWFPNSYKMPPGLTRAAEAVVVEERRRYDEVPYVVTERGFEQAGLL